MQNPYSVDRETLTDEDAKRILAVQAAFAELFDVLIAQCPQSRLLSIALTDIEHAHAMAVKSIHGGVLA